jgi:uncharacterized protein (DUF342 family)
MCENFLFENKELLGILEQRMPENPLHEKGVKINVSIVEAKMKAMVTIKAPENEQDLQVTLQDVLSTLKIAGVNYGINEEVINKYIEDKKWGETFLAAEGLPPSTGEDAKIEYYFPTSKSLKPRITAEGIIDYKEVDAVGSIGKDEILIKKIPAMIGSPGKNVMGDSIPGKFGKDTNVVAGGGTYKDPADQMIIRAAIDGVTAYNQNTNTVEVQKLYIIPGSVDFSTGNVHVKSSIEIKGDVNPGFILSTPYDIYVNGIIEHSTVTCEGTLTAKGGIVGDGQQLIKIGGDLHSGYIRNQRINCCGSVYASSEILSSVIECKDEVVITKMEGIILGGKITASNKVSAGRIGNKYDVPTEIEVGINFCVRDKYLSKLDAIKESNKQIDEIRKKIDIINSRPPDLVSNNRFKSLNEQLRAAIEQCDRLNIDLKEIEKEYYNVNAPVVNVYRKVFPGVTIKIKNSVFEIKEELSHVMFRLNGDKVEYISLK